MPIPTVMKLLALPSSRITGACAVAVGLWVGVLALLRATRVPVDARDAFGLLIVIGWGCLVTRLGIRKGRTRRQVATNFMVTGVVILLYEAAIAAGH